MTDTAPPKLGLPRQSEFKVPTLESPTAMDNPNGSPAVQKVRDSGLAGLVRLLAMPGAAQCSLADFTDSLRCLSRTLFFY